MSLSVVIVIGSWKETSVRSRAMPIIHYRSETVGEIQKHRFSSHPLQHQQQLFEFELNFNFNFVFALTKNCLYITLGMYYYFILFFEEEETDDRNDSCVSSQHRTEEE